MKYFKVGDRVTRNGNRAEVVAITTDNRVVVRFDSDIGKTTRCYIYKESDLFLPAKQIVGTEYAVYIYDEDMTFLDVMITKTYPGEQTLIAMVETQKYGRYARIEKRFEVVEVLI